VRSWQLKKYKGNDNKPLDLVNPAVGSSEVAVSVFPLFRRPAADRQSQSGLLHRDAGCRRSGHRVRIQRRPLRVRKTFRFRRDSYLCEVTSAVTVDQRPLANAIEWRGGFGDLTVANAASKENTIYFNPVENKLFRTRRQGRQGRAIAGHRELLVRRPRGPVFRGVFLPETTEVLVGRSGRRLSSPPSPTRCARRPSRSQGRWSAPRFPWAPTTISGCSWGPRI